jgi:FixJ family two-component response regulator
MGKRGARSHHPPSTKQLGDRASSRSGTVLILLDDAPLAAKLLRLFKRKKLEVKTYSCHRQLLASNLPICPACLVACVSGGDLCGLPAYEKLKQNGIYLPVVFLAKTADFRLAVKAMRAGAEDLLPFPFEKKELLASVSSALERSRQFLKLCADQLELRRRAASLTEREREIVKLVVSGMLNKEIASHLKLALVTVKVHRGNAMRKLRARTSAELARIARASGISVGLGDSNLSALALKSFRPTARQER